MSESETVAPGLDEGNDAKTEETQVEEVSPETTDVTPDATSEDEARPSDNVTDPAFHKHFGTVETIMDALKDVVDPELGVNVVDLGLVYGVDIDDQGRATVDMTLTSPMCPLTDRLEADVHYLLSEITSAVTLNWVWLPPWSLDMISEDGREQLRAIGFNL